MLLHLIHNIPRTVPGRSHNSHLNSSNGGLETLKAVMLFLLCTPWLHQLKAVKSKVCNFWEENCLMVSSIWLCSTMSRLCKRFSNCVKTAEANENVCAWQWFSGFAPESWTGKCWIFLWFYTTITAGKINIRLQLNALNSSWEAV